LKAVNNDHAVVEEIRLRDLHTADENLRERGNKYILEIKLNRKKKTDSDGKLIYKLN